MKGCLCGTYHPQAASCFADAMRISAKEAADKIDEKNPKFHGIDLEEFWFKSKRMRPTAITYHATGYCNSKIVMVGR